MRAVHGTGGGSSGSHVRPLCLLWPPMVVQRRVLTDILSGPHCERGSRVCCGGPCPTAGAHRTGRLLCNLWAAPVRRWAALMHGWAAPVHPPGSSCMLPLGSSHARLGSTFAQLGSSYARLGSSCAPLGSSYAQLGGSCAPPG